MTPGYIFFILNLVIDFTAYPKLYAGFILFSSTAQKMVYTNHGINFFLYVISGQKFRNDMKELLRIKNRINRNSDNDNFGSKFTEIKSISTM